MSLLETKTYVNTNNPATGQTEFVCVYTGDGFTAIKPLWDTTGISVQSLAGSVEFNFLTTTISTHIANIELLTTELVEIVSLPDSGRLYFDSEVVLQGFTFPWADLTKLKFVSDEHRFNVAQIQLRVRPTPNPVSAWSDLLTISFDILKE